MGRSEESTTVSKVTMVSHLKHVIFVGVFLLFLSLTVGEEQEQEAVGVGDVIKDNMVVREAMPVAEAKRESKPGKKKGKGKKGKRNGKVGKGRNKKVLALIPLL